MNDVNFLLKILSKLKTETVTLSYSDYRKYFSITQVPAVKEIRDGKDKETILYVKVNREKAAKYLETKHDFYNKKRLEDTLNEFSSEFHRVVQR